ncbi:amidohydrolase [Microbacterium sp. EYE_5]|uniref:amidohydrolase n=1 Tax=unclassified Microbacterium TaxID=2609290 RepID=UPI0020036D19|nr:MULTISPECIES: amidohydrolase [unclassified Microbacterium]MCK6081631.1 amidohydrolase [Microbacterium sp. EYE_382]MCK6086901.1 amidohydrolase [Microbacterium sp. EYE_384]MCK6123601.1 amidohydrolase [Microbacterium sp. EYE_80]MCK6126510.1 amidohydrolase [Microbacterium sp. EYE_79]MCK6142585.1 amidohydrolase [Microbacterium sp. EYE_39]
MSHADLVITGAVVHTVDADHSRATAFAVREGRFVAVGSDADVAPFIGDATVVRDLGGAAVVPGLVDGHAHHLIAGEGDLFQLRFAPTAGFDEVVEAVRSYAEGLGPDEWVVGEMFGSVLLEDFSREEARRRIDDAAGGRPVVLTDDSHHNKFANTAALAAAGIGDDTPDPDHGRIVRDPDTGKPSGLLMESATIAVTEAVDAQQPRTPERSRQASARAIQILHSYGVTAFQDAAATVEIMCALRDLDEGGDLHAWVVSSLLSSEFLFANTPHGDELVARREEFRTRHHRPDFVKVALDGIPPTQTAAFLTPYLADEEHGHAHCGTTTMAPDELEAWLLRTAAQGLGAKIHCTGDASVRVALDAIEAVRDAGHDGVRYQIAHGQFIHPDDRRRMVRLAVSNDMSPYLWFPGVIPDAIAAVRAQPEATQMHPVRDLIDLGVHVFGGSDWPVGESPNPWEGIQGLVTRADPLGRAPGTLWAEQAITLDEALTAFSRGAAEAMGLGDETGSIAPGLSADFVVLDQDPFAVPSDRLVRTHAVETWFAGDLVYTRPTD